MKNISLAVIPGDGIGKEVVPAALRVLDAAAELHGELKFTCSEFPWSCEYHAAHGRMMPEGWDKTLAGFEAIFLGAVGLPQLVADHVSLWEFMMAIRRGFQQYVNLRPVKLLRGIASPLRDKTPHCFDFVVVRENNEGEYSDIGGRIYSGTPDEAAIQEAFFSRRGCERVLRYAFERGRQARRRRLVSVTKSNGITHTMPFWDQITGEVAANYPDVEWRLMHVDAAAACFVLRPEELDVVVASNLFGDILTDLGGAIMGSIGMAPAANLNPERKFPSMFEPVHGSAPDIAGRGIANPIGQIWTGALMLEWFGEPSLAARLVTTIEDTLEAGVKTPDLGGRATTREVSDAVIARLLKC
ncbi:MAG: tartrate dehydrogenase [Verrucomicrobia bacterium]|nr:tartrate dehydrogenase [Verrucomicrobiota bacterium]